MDLKLKDFTFIVFQYSLRQTMQKQTSAVDQYPEEATSYLVVCYKHLVVFI